MTTALLLTGAAAKGAFEAGALAVLAGAGISFTRIVAASAGALTGTLFALATRAGRPVEGAVRIAEVWRTRATWSGILDISTPGLFHLRGVSTTDRLRSLLREESAGFGAGSTPVGLRLVVAPANGARGEIGGEPATTYELALRFDDAELDPGAKRDEVFLAAAASAAFPGIYLPPVLPGIGPCFDGGTVNNAPIKYALEDPEIERVVALAVQPAEASPPDSLGGTDLVGLVAEILVNERLYRDLREATLVNAQLAALQALRAEGVLSADALGQVLRALGWQQRRPVELVVIRPDATLPGNPFTAFDSASLRADYLEAGAAAAQKALEKLTAS